MIDVGINNLTRFFFDKRFFIKVVKNILYKEGLDFGKVSIAFLPEKRVREINKVYRRQDKATDVLSFGRNKADLASKEPFLGEVVVCPSVVWRNAGKKRLEFNEEITRCLIHGVLHLLDYDHKGRTKEAKRMLEKQELFLSEYFS